MNWDLKTAAGREKLMILRRKLNMLYSMQPDLFAGKPYSFFHYMAEDCVLRSEKLPEPLTGQAIRDFLIREKQISTGLGPTMMTNMVESTADGDILLRIRKSFRDETPDGELVRLELNRKGKVSLIERFAENRLQYRKFTTSVCLVPVREVREGNAIRYEKDHAEEIFFSSLYYDEMSLIFDLLPECPSFDDMEERYMDLSAWTGILNTWKEINETENDRDLRARLLRAEEEYIRSDPDYEKELGERIRTILQKREPYGRRMQAWMEDWLKSCVDEYECIWKC